MVSVEICVPNIGDFKDVPVVEVHIGRGSDVALGDPLITVQSDKATMEIPSPHAGRIIEVLVKTGDRVSEGTPLVRLEERTAAVRSEPTPAHIPDASTPRSAALPAGAALEADVSCDVLVLGAGPGGYSAAFRAADLGLRTVLVERYPTLGGVCLNVGCIPSKALLHVAAVIDEAALLGSHGVTFAAPEVDLDALRRHKDKVVGKLTSGLASMAKGRNVSVLQGTGRFSDAHSVEVALASGGKTVVKFEKAIIAAGSEAIRLPFLPEDPRIVDSTGALKLQTIPKRMLVIGGGIIGLEMATVYATLGSRIDVVEMLDRLMPGADHDLVNVWQKYNAKRFNRIMLKTKAATAEAKSDGIHVRFDGAEAPTCSEVYDLILVAAGRRPNGKQIGAEIAGVGVDDRNFIPVDRQMRTNIAHIFAVGDIASPPMLAHKAVHEGHIAAEAAAGKSIHFDARQIPSVAYTDPEISWAGKTEDELAAEGVKFAKAIFPWAASGRALANARSEGFTKLLFEEGTERIIGGGIVGARAGDLIAEISLAIEMGADATDIGKTIHPHPTLSETIGMAAEVLEGVCTDMPPKQNVS
jgi:dihydrolipoyl dehydrogenase